MSEKLMENFPPRVEYSSTREFIEKDLIANSLMVSLDKAARREITPMRTYEQQLASSRPRLAEGFEENSDLKTNMDNCVQQINTALEKMPVMSSIQSNKWKIWEINALLPALKELAKTVFGEEEQESRAKKWMEYFEDQKRFYANNPH